MPKNSSNGIQWDDIDKVRFYGIGTGMYTLITMALHPINVLKTRQQVLSDSNVRQLNKSSAQRIRGMYRGLGIVLVMAVPARGIYIGTLEHSKDYLQKYLQKSNFSIEQQPIIASISGSIAGGFASGVAQSMIVPMDVVSQRQMVMNEPAHSRRGSAFESDESDESGESEESDIEVPNDVMKRVRQVCSDTGTRISQSGAIRAKATLTSEQKAANNKKRTRTNQDDFLKTRIEELRNGPTREWSKPNAFGENVAFTWDDLVLECKESGFFDDKNKQQIYDRIERSSIWIDEDTTPTWSKPELEYIRRIVSDMIDCEWKDKSGTLVQKKDLARLHEEDHELRKKDLNQIHKKIYKICKEIEVSQNVATGTTIDTTSDSTSNTNDIVPEVVSVDTSNASALNTERVTIPEWHPDQNEHLANRIRFLRNNGSTTAWRQPDANGEMKLYTADQLAVEIFNNPLFGDKTLEKIKCRIKQNSRWIDVRFRKEWHPEATEHIRHIVRELNERNWKDENDVTLKCDDVVAELRTDTGILRDKNDSMIKNKLYTVRKELKRENTVA